MKNQNFEGKKIKGQKVFKKKGKKIKKAMAKEEPKIQTKFK